MKKYLHALKILLAVFFGFLEANALVAFFNKKEKKQNPPSIKLPKTSFLYLFAILGSLLFSMNVSGQTQTIIYTTAGGSTWTCPPGVTSIQVEAWGAGGGGGGTNANPSAGGGGGGGAYAKSTIAVTPGNSYTLNVGAAGTAGSNAGGIGGTGGSSSFAATTVVATGGNGGIGTSYGAAGAGASSGCTGTTIFNGGNGSAGVSVTSGGAGGGGAGNAANGGNATTTAAGIGGNLGGGIGGSGRSSVGAGNSGTAPGGGGSGGIRSNGTARAGGAGGAGQIIITYMGYCTPISSAATTYFSNVTTNGGATNFNNNSSYSAPGYANYFATYSASQVAGSSFTVSFTLVTGISAGVAIWIDWNKNNVFDTGEIVYNSATYLSSGTVAIPPTITVPGGQAAGDYVMRILTDYNAINPTPCAYSPTAQGEAEDYKLMVTAAVACSGTPSTNTIAVSPASGIAGSTYGVTATGYSTTTGLTFQWQFSDTGGAPWTNQGTATSSYAALTGLTAPAFGVVRTWQLLVTCTSSGLTGASTVGTFTSGYCASTGTATTYYISNFTTTSGITNINKTSTGTAGGYVDYSATDSCSQTAGLSINYSISSIVGAGTGLSLFADWNNDGDFADANESLGGTSSYTKLNPFTGSFTVPAGTPAGSYRLRVVDNYNSSTPASCNSGITGETEDYTFTVVAAVNPTITLATNTVAAGNITQNTTNSPIYSFAISPTVASATLTGLKVTTSGSYIAGDITNLKAYYQATTPFVLGSATLLSTLTTPGTAGSKTFPSFTSKTFANGATGYIFITTDTPCATVGNTILASVVAGDTTFSLGTATGSPAAGNTQTYIAAVPNNVTGAAALVANASSSVSWAIPTSCYSEVMIVASPAANTGGTPTGNGSAYTANLTYGSATAFGNGWVAYKGSASPEVITGLTNGTPYFYKIFTRNDKLWSTGVEVSATPSLYCIPSMTSASASGDYIKNVTFAGINNTTGDTATDYTYYYPTPAASVNAGTSYPISLLAGGASSLYAQQFGVWIDYNQNGSFTDAGEFVFATTVANFSPTASTGTIVIPALSASVLAGTTRMRVGSRYSTAVVAGNSCIGGSSFGEYEDYNITITAPALCVAPLVQPTSLILTPAGTSVAGSFTASASANGYVVVRTTTAAAPTNPTSATAYATGSTALGATTYVVQSSSATTFTDTPLSTSTQYWYWVYAYNDGCTGQPAYLTSGPLTGNTTTTNVLPYCIPAPTSIDGTGITRVDIGSTINNVVSRGGLRYNDYTTLMENVVQGATIPYKLQFTTGYSYYYEVWVDWNDDGDFADYNEEMSFGRLATGTLLSSNFVVPVDAPLGNHRLRIGIRYANFPTPCYSSSFAQFEDYTLNVTALCTTGTPSSLDGSTFINGLEAKGTLNDVVSTGSAGYSPGGYKDNSSITLATQIPDGPVNLIIDVTGDSFIYVFVDWNSNGNFNDPGETVYSTTSTTTGSGTATDDTSFGFIVPSGQLPGNYKMRVRTSPYGNTYPGSGIISPCDTGYSSGEAEDFTLEIVADCPSKITSVIPGSNCGPGAVSIGAASPSATQFKWYSTKKGGTAFDTTATGSTTISSVSATTTYYVTSLNGTCESLYRTPVKATIFPIANIVFTPTTPEICGTGSIIELSASGDSSIDDLFVEDFETGTFGKFTAMQIKGSVSSAPWSIKTSSYIPNNTTVFKPAINSGGAGTSGNKFAFTTSDAAPNPGFVTSSQSLETTAAINTIGYKDLTLTFDQYYSQYSTDKVYLEVSQEGAAYTLVTTFDVDDGYAADFQSKTIDFTPYINTTNLKFRLRYDASWDDGYAVDNFRLFGTKPLTTNFDWGVNDGNMYTDALATTTPYVSHALVPKVYIKPDVSSAATWTYTANTSLPNGCPVSKTIVVPNNTRISNASSTDWNSANWLPDSSVPDANKCVIVKTPVTLGAGIIGLAKNVTVEGLSGNLTIGGNLTVIDFVKNTTGDADNLTVKSDANLIQINPLAPNAGSIRAERSVANLRFIAGNGLSDYKDYVYWSSPVAGQQTKGAGGFSPGTPDNRFYYYRESNDRFYETGDTTFTPGRGYAVQAESTSGLGSPYSKTYLFKGTPNNGDVNFNISRSADTVSGGITSVHGYNLVGNPYPSNITFDELYKGNVSGLIWNTAWFWKNASYTQYQQGSGYGGNNYAVYNGTGGNNATTTTGQPAYVTGIITVGQGFLVQKKVQSTEPLIFKNSYSVGHDLRVRDAGTFYQKGSSQKNRYWLTLLAPSNLINSQLIGYVEGATNDYEQDYDAEAFDLSSDLFYSILPTKRLLIQGKSEAFTDEDKVTLGANFFQNGSYTIALANAEGIFNGSQNIYLKDKQEGIITNLSQGAYTFTANTGDNATRFEIIYKPETVLATDASVKEDLVVYRKENDFVIKSPNKKITTLEVYDTAGRLIYTARPKSTEAVIPAEKLLNSVYVVKINRVGEISTKKIIR